MKQLDFLGEKREALEEPVQYNLWDENERVTKISRTVDYESVNELFTSFDSDEIEKYKTYWESVVPKNDTEVFQRWLFAFMSVHTTWEANVKGYEAVKDWTKWMNRDDELERILVESRVGLHKNRTRYLSEFSKKFWNNPEWYKYQEGEDWQEFRDKLVKGILGLGIAKVSFSLEMIYPNHAKVTCMDTHLFQAYGLDQSKDARRYKEIENYWLDMCSMWNVPSTIARAILWDRKQDQTDSRYWSYVLED